MIVEQPVGEGADEVHDEGVHVVGVPAEGDVSAADDVVPTAIEEPSIPSPTPPTPPPQPSQDIPSTSQVQPTPPQSPQAQQATPQPQPQPLQDAGLPMDLLQNLLDTCTTLKRKEAKDVATDAKADQDAEDDEVELAELKEVVEVVTTAKLITEVVTTTSSTITVAALTLTTAPSAAKRRKGVVIRDQKPKPLKRQAQIKQDEAYAKELEAELNKNIDWDEVIDHVQRKQKEDNVVKRYQELKRMPQTEAQARKNMIYLKNVAGFKMDYFKGMTYDDICPIFKKKFNSNVAFLLKTKEQMDEEESRALKRLSESQDDKASKRQKLDEEVPVVDYEIYTENNQPYYKIKRADGSLQLYLSFLSMLRNFDREDLEVLWELVKERFASTKPQNLSDDFLMITLGATFEKPDIITFTTTQLILLVERRYPLTRFTLDQLINTVRLEVKEESEVSLALLSFGVDPAEDIKENMLSDYCCEVKLMLLINADKSN
nr:hypothetical protein [Tanacetum cinerariifolium]